MAEVHPLYKYEDIQRVRENLTKRGKIREAECFFIACHIGLRSCDLLTLKFDDMKGKRVTVTEKKTGKKRDFPLTKVVSDSLPILKKFYQDKNVDPVYLFQTTGNIASGRIKPISYTHLFRTLKVAFLNCEIDGNLATHTMRKTFGYHMYKKHGDLPLIQKMFNHASPAETLNYIGVTKQTIDQAYWSLDFSL